MAQQLNVYGQSLGWTYSLNPGDEPSFIVFGAPAEAGNVVLWLTAHPLVGYAIRENVVEITHFQYEASVNPAGPQPNRRIFFNLKNVGDEVVTSVEIHAVWTDAIQ